MSYKSNRASLVTVEGVIIGGRKKSRIYHDDWESGSDQWYGTIPSSATPSRTSGSDVESQVVGGSEKSTDEKSKRFRMNPRMISDAIIGLSDGLTVPFALSAGLSAFNDSQIVVLGGLAELIAGAISMGLGGFIGAKSEAQSYQATVDSTKEVMHKEPRKAAAWARAVFRNYRLGEKNISQAVESLQSSEHDMLDFLMRFHHQVGEPDVNRPIVSALTIAGGYFFGGFIPLLPYIIIRHGSVLTGLWWSIGVMAIALFVFGWGKTGIVLGWTGRQNIIACLKGAMQMLIIGSAAAAAAVGLVRAINQH